MRSLAFPLAIAALLAGCIAAPPAPDAPAAAAATRPGVVIETDEGPITLVLYPDLMPQTTERFLSLAREGFYDERIWQRVVDNFVIQSEERDGDPTETLPLEESRVHFAAGVIGMARGVEEDSATHVFFITEYPQMHLHRPDGATLVLGTYAGFGQVLDGFDAIRAIAAKPKRAPPEQERPVEDARIVSVREANVSVPEDFDDVYPLVVAGRVDSRELRVSLEHARTIRAGEPARVFRVFVESRVDRSAEVPEDVQLVAVTGAGRETIDIALERDAADPNVRVASAAVFPSAGEWRVIWPRGDLPVAEGPAWTVQVEEAR